MATNFQWQGLCWLKHWCWDSFPVLATMSIEGVCLIDHKIVGWSCPQKNIIIIEALISGGKKKMKIAQKLISNSNLINFRRNINPSSQAGSWGVPNAMAEHRCLPSPIPRQCLWRSPSLRSQIEMLSFYAQSHTHSWIAKSPKLFALQSENVLQAIIST